MQKTFIRTNRETLQSGEFRRNSGVITAKGEDAQSLFTAQLGLRPSRSHTKSARLPLWPWLHAL